MIQDKTEYPEYTKDQEIHDLKDIINSLERKIKNLEDQLSISRVLGQSEQLLDFERWIEKHTTRNLKEAIKLALNNYKKENCG